MKYISLFFVFVFAFTIFASGANAECLYYQSFLDSQNRPTNMQFTAAAQSGIIQIKPSEVSCPPNYNIASESSWITITRSSTDPNVYFYTVEPNTEDTERMGGILIGTPTFGGSLMVSQQAKSCTYSVSLSMQTFPSSGGTGQVNIQTPAGCRYWILSYDDFILARDRPAPSGNTTPNSYYIFPNKGAARTGTITVMGQAFTINQAGVKSRKRRIVF
jgi:hypothetical protein